MAKKNHKIYQVDSISHRKLSGDEEFYAEMDKDKTKSRFKGFWFLTVFILLVVVGAIISTALFAKRITIATGFSSPKIDFSSQDFVSFDQRISSFSGDQAQINLSDLELAYYLGAYESDFPISTTRLENTSDGVYIGGRQRGNLVFWPISIKAVPEVKDKKISFNFSTNENSNWLLTSKTKTKITDHFNQKIIQPIADEGYILFNIETYTGYVIITFIKN